MESHIAAKKRERILYAPKRRLYMRPPSAGRVEACVCAHDRAASRPLLRRGLMRKRMHGSSHKR
eukprot:1505892-Pleurochrysis_carterae.AAC.1